LLGEPSFDSLSEPFEASLTEVATSSEVTMLMSFYKELNKKPKKLPRIRKGAS
jgi:hypothetical protein